MSPRNALRPHRPGTTSDTCPDVWPGAHDERAVAGDVVGPARADRRAGEIDELGLGERHWGTYRAAALRAPSRSHSGAETITSALERADAADVVRVQVRGTTQRTSPGSILLREASADLVLRPEPEPRQPQERMQREWWLPARRQPSARCRRDRAQRVVDEEHVDGKRVVAPAPAEVPPHSPRGPLRPHAPGREPLDLHAQPSRPRRRCSRSAIGTTAPRRRGERVQPDTGHRLVADPCRRARSA
jgi:hypothetical protein